MKAKTIILLAFLIYVHQIKAQNVITVDNAVGSDAQYDNLQAAIDAAGDNDILYIHASENTYGDITVNKKLTLIGFSHSDPDKSTLITDISLGENASNSKFSGLHITDDFIIDNLNTTITGLIFENNIVEDQMKFRHAGVDNIIIRGNIIRHIGTRTTSVLNNNYTNTIITNNIILGKINLRKYQSVTIKNNIFLYSGTGFTIQNNESGNGSITVQDNIFYVSSNATIDKNAPGVIFEYCLVYNIGSGNVDALTGTNNIDNEDPLFVAAANDEFDPDIDDYHLQTGSPAIGAGVNGGDIGIYNSGSFKFNNSGHTADIPTVKIIAITNTVATGENLEVTIESNSN